MTNAVSVAQYGSSNPTMRNRIINGAMVINQRGFSGTAVDATYSLDRWALTSTQASKYTVSQSSTAPTGFTNSILATSSSAYSVSSSDYFSINQFIEGFNTADLGWGTATAKAVTLSFWVQSSLTGTFGGAIVNSGTSYSYPFSYSIPVANTWTQISITIAGPTSGTWVGATNGVGMRIYFSLGAGTSQSGSAGSWASAFYTSATGAVSVVGTSGATFYFTGVQLEAGTTATPFEYRQYTNELQLCQRYYWKIYSGTYNYQVFTILTFEATAIAWGPVNLKVTMRTIPSATKNGNWRTSYGTAGTFQVDNNQSGPDLIQIGWTGGSGGTPGYSSYWTASSDPTAYLAMSAEL